MEKKGIRTEKGELNRWIKATNRMIRSMRATIAALKEWIQEAKEILKEPQEIFLAQLLSEARTMGHFDAGVTLSVYTHASYAHAAEQMAKISQFRQSSETKKDRDFAVG